MCPIIRRIRDPRGDRVSKGSRQNTKASGRRGGEPVGSRANCGGRDWGCDQALFSHCDLRSFCGGHISREGRGARGHQKLEDAHFRTKSPCIEGEGGFYCACREGGPVMGGGWWVAGMFGSIKTGRERRCGRTAAPDHGLWENARESMRAL